MTLPSAKLNVLGVFQRPLTLILLQEHRDTNGRHIAIQIGGVYTTFCQEERILLQKYRDRNGRCIAMLLIFTDGPVRCTTALMATSRPHRARESSPTLFGRVSDI